jgi:predicted transcriptional regulator
MPDDTASSSHITLRVPHDLAEALDRLAAILERPRSWVMVRALRQYLKAEGAEILDDSAAIAELDRGDSAPIEEVIAEVDEIAKRSGAKRARKR